MISGVILNKVLPLALSSITDNCPTSVVIDVHVLHVFGAGCFFAVFKFVPSLYYFFMWLLYACKIFWGRIVCLGK